MEKYNRTLRESSPRFAGTASRAQRSRSGYRVGGRARSLTYATNLTAMNALVTDLQSKYADNKLRISIHKVSRAQRSRSGYRVGGRARCRSAGTSPRCRQRNQRPLDYTLQVNLRASFILVKGAVEHMKSQNWGRIVFMNRFPCPAFEIRISGRWPCSVSICWNIASMSSAEPKHGVHLALTYATNLTAMNALVTDLQSKYADNKLRSRSGYRVGGRARCRSAGTSPRCRQRNQRPLYGRKSGTALSKSSIILYRSTCALHSFSSRGRWSI
jgi:hypothetical protein